MIDWVIGPEVETICPDLTDDGAENCGCSFCSPSEALADLYQSPNDLQTHAFSVAAGAYVGLQPLRILGGRKVRFDANGGTVTLTNSGVGEVFTASDYGELTLVGPFSLSAFNDRALRLDSNAHVTLNGTVLFTIGLQQEGGAVRVQNAELDAINALFLDNVATGDGGQLLAVDSTVTLTGCRFSGGFGGNGGAVAFVKQNAEVATLTATDTTFEDNLAASAGGAIYVEGGATVTLTDDTFDRNTAVTDGGAVADAEPGDVGGAAATVTISGSTFTDNVAGANGGAIRLLNGTTLDADRSTFQTNDARTGGALWLGGVAQAILTRDLWCENTADHGGAIATSTSIEQYWRGNRMIGNTGQATGGAIDHQGGPLTLDHFNLLVNASGRGGAVASRSASLAVRSSLIGWTAGAIAFDADDLDLGWNLFWRNGLGDWSSPAFQDRGGLITGADPRLDRFVPGLGCDAADDYYSWYGPLVDAGDPGDLPDPDDSVDDIGAFGVYSLADQDTTPWAVDVDGDLWPALYDCVDGNGDIHPGLDDPGYDGVDQNCDDADDFDLDADGYRGDVDDCNDLDPTVHPNAEDTPTADLNCDDKVDFDGDGFDKSVDCDDRDPDVHGGATEDSGPKDLDCVGPYDVVRPVLPRTCATGPIPGSEVGWGAVVWLAWFSRRGLSGRCSTGRTSETRSR